MAQPDEYGYFFLYFDESTAHKALWSLVRYPMRAQPFHDRGYDITIRGCWRTSPKA